MFLLIPKGVGEIEVSPNRVVPNKVLNRKTSSGKCLGYWVFKIEIYIRFVEDVHLSFSANVPTRMGV